MLQQGVQVDMEKKRLLTRACYAELALAIRAEIPARDEWAPRH